jgi:intracellular sulfur oxidation DsrE/DsrF family protein
MKALNIVSTAYRATIEEQDDTIVWITHAMKGAGADIDVLLKGNAINYAVKGQNAAGLSFGGIAQTHPPDIERDVKSLVDKGVNVHVIEEDVAERGLERNELIDGLKPVSRKGVAKLLDGYDHVWHW